MGVQPEKTKASDSKASTSSATAQKLPASTGPTQAPVKTKADSTAAAQTSETSSTAAGAAAEAAPAVHAEPNGAAATPPKQVSFFDTHYPESCPGMLLVRLPWLSTTSMSCARTWRAPWRPARCHSQPLCCCCPAVCYMLHAVILLTTTPPFAPQCMSASCSNSKLRPSHR